MGKPRYKRNPHPGVQIKPRTWKSGLTTFIARFTDPDTNRTVDISLTKLGLDSADSRKDWAIIKSRSIMLRQAEIASGARRKTETPIEQALREYMDLMETKLRKSTLAAYRDAIARLRAWAIAEGVTYTEQITPSNLWSLQARILIPDKKVAVAGGKRGLKRMSGVKRSPHSVNQDMRSLRTLLNRWRKRGITPQLSSDSITDALEFMPVPKPIIEFLNKDQVSELLRAAMRHDAECFKETREEHKSGTRKGQTARYQPVAPLVAYLLLTGCRADEGFGLKWSDWNQKERQIELREVDRIKTGHARIIDLMITPLLEKLLALLKLKSAGEFVFGGAAPLPKSHAYSTRRRLINEFGAPKFTWQMLRKTCGTFLSCSQGIYGSASTYYSARRLGHSIEVAERHYLGLMRSVPTEAKTLEAAMQIEDLMAALCTTQAGEQAISTVWAYGDPPPALSGGER
jgi:integrase